MSDIDIRVTGSAGRITLTREKALNALSYDMCMAIDAALKDWATNDAVKIVVIDACGEKAFCAGGDIAELYATGTKGDYGYGRTFWRDEYRLNARIFEYPKPVVSFLQGFTMGGGVGIGCHGTHRIVCESSQISMPETGIGLIPDVGGTLILALAPGRLGEYLGLTAGRMKAADAIYAGFADHYIPQEKWPGLITALEQDGNPDILANAAEAAPDGTLESMQGDIDRLFAGETLNDILTVLEQDGSEFAATAQKPLMRNSPLSMAATVEILHRLRGATLTIRKALDLEYRFTYRSMEKGDFLEGIRAQIIDKDRQPKWQYADRSVPAVAVSQMLMPLGADALTFEEE
ncbi:enoyl-CoA hydratase/isomerase family protein [Phaeobacter gallaeciensis]|uniref:enoyl-CoA hydratase/isomerase family protein n=1 Tax=Phaeobacter gallaeciensis TaxID=60890 RepID=UPI00237EECD1|nr:enoyl-CoA hydratase/isomerase family protein [Phaeobacter gallaeciensis]MDE4096579.1 enoyl-CoA hydratase/isomerase family protein [Phaeobacter gallaeciensis]MDE4105390.1 enoyl-CoA hydratase/isomerase family protein [Phaeobacter gallaeciensis]MDE4109846.1 enoyl-CoA hydratase/isomerase family protein [Phaeobacter gallaeciensis]MDE4114314.1 enoyl-CoA hydratase/isomerase family protein [Phaeobacter gallaeciensis]MDE4118781.1 enoyl-CoA hydratase/isomerase family protein [Phaeobacter gallaeciensi